MDAERVCTRRGMLIAAATAPLGLIAVAVAAPPRRETDLRRVYARLAVPCQLAGLSRWCGLPLTPATALETAAITAAFESAPDADRGWCGPVVARWRLAFPLGWVRFDPGVLRLPLPVAWFRLSDILVPGRWIGVGACREYNTGEWTQWVVGRAAMGFGGDAG